MALCGKGMLITFTEVNRRDEQDFNEWYNREHIDERVNLPGFKRARRYVAVKGSPKYFATYECSKVDDLATVLHVSDRGSAVTLLTHDRLVDETVVDGRRKQRSRELNGSLFGAGGSEDINRHGMEWGRAFGASLRVISLWYRVKAHA